VTKLLLVTNEFSVIFCITVHLQHAKLIRSFMQYVWQCWQLTFVENKIIFTVSVNFCIICDSPSECLPLPRKICNVKFGYV